MFNLKRFMGAMLLSVASIHYAAATNIDQDFYAQHNALVPVSGSSTINECDQYITRQILSYTTKDDMGSVSSVSKQFNDVMKGQVLWFEFCQREGYVNSKDKFDNGFNYYDRYKSLAQSFMRVITSDFSNRITLCSISEDGNYAVGYAINVVNNCPKAIIYNTYENQVNLMQTLKNRIFSQAFYINVDGSVIWGQTADEGEFVKLCRFKCKIDTYGNDTEFEILGNYPVHSLSESNDNRKQMCMKFNALDMDSLAEFLGSKGLKHFDNYELTRIQSTNAAGNMLIVECMNKLSKEENTFILKLHQITIDFDAIKKREMQ